MIAMKPSRSTAILRRRFAVPRRLQGDAGQILAMMAIGSVALIGMSALVVDVGAGFRGQRKAQSAADGSALAAAQQLPSSPGQAKKEADAVAAKNLPDGTVQTTFASTYVANDTAVTKADTTSPSFLGKILGFQIFAESAKARAITGSYTGWSKGMSPWVTDQASIKWGKILTFKVKPGDQASSGNFGAARLPVNENNCIDGSGGSDYRKLIGGSYKSCVVNVGGKLNPETGNLAGPTGQGLADRGVIQNFDPYKILTQLPNGDWVLTTYDHPNLIVIPVIDQFNNGNSNPFTVVGFAWFIITSYTNTTVTGMFIGSEVPGGAKCLNGGGGTMSCPVGGYTPYGFKVIQLTE
jgi:Putative Flp pilus-assembly TadE/G-like